ncbi:helicase [Paenibacillus sp. TC-CSREp1]|uniref:helicase n=1 Tax=Paenibacillus sp. TC-CSREp1 TaxID=3410089 RepID=UPI003CF1E68C
MPDQEGIYPHCPVKIRIVEVGGLTQTQLQHKLQQCSIQINEYGKTLLTSEKFIMSHTKKRLQTVELAVKHLGFRDGAATLQLFQTAVDLGLQLCPMELGPYLGIQYLDQFEVNIATSAKENQAPPGSVTIASKPLTEDDYFPKGFYLRRINDELWLRGYVADDLHVWNPDDRFIFCRADSIE